MQKKRSKQSSDDSLALMVGPRIRPAELKRLLYDLANTQDDNRSLERLRREHRTRLGRYSLSQLGMYRDELRILWHPAPLEGIPEGIPDDEYKAYQKWLEKRPNAEPGEMICNRWLGRSEVGLLAVWEKDRRELRPSAEELPAMLVYGCLLFADRLCYCENPKCSVPWFIGSRRDQHYCSSDCAWPAKKAAKRKWWKRNRAKKLLVGQSAK
jgi:hypothetical protein